MAIALKSIGGLFFLMALVLFFEASRAKDAFAMSFSLDLGLIGAIAFVGGAVVRAVNRLQHALSAGKS